MEMGGGAKWYGMWGWEQLPTLPFSPEGPSSKVAMEKEIFGRRPSECH